MSVGGVGTAVKVRFFMPSPELAPYVSTYYLTEAGLGAEGRIEDWLHPEWANIRFSRSNAWTASIGAGPEMDLPHFIVTGPTSYATRFNMGTMRSWGIGLLPLGWARLVGVAASDYADRAVDGAADPALRHLSPLLNKVFGNSDDPAGEAARIDAFLLGMLDERPPVEAEERIRTAHQILLSLECRTVNDCAERMGMSPRSLERLSRRIFGFPPKLLLRRQRFMRSLGQFMLDPSLAWIETLDSHYVDQAHFVRDFRRFMTMSPSAYAALDHPVIRAAAQARTAAAGAPVQALHQP